MQIIVKNKFGEEIERHETTRPTVHEWLWENVQSYRDAQHHPISIFKNGRFLPFGELKEPCSEDDLINIIIEPQSGAELYWLYAALFVASAYMAYEAQQAMKDFQGNDFEGLSGYNSARISANTAKKNGVIREMFGQFNIYPDLLVKQPIRRYENYQETIRMLLCVGVGEFEFTGGNIANNFYIGDTPKDEFENQINLTVYDPGDTLPTPNTWFGDPSIEIQYVGSGATCSIKIEHTTHLTNKKKLTTYVDGVVDQVVYLTDYATVSSFVTAVNALADYTCTLLANGTLNPQEILSVTIDDIKTAPRKIATAVASVIIQYVGAGSAGAFNVRHNTLGATQLTDAVGLSVYTAKYPTIASLASYINGLADYTCSVRGTSTYPSSALFPAQSALSHNIDNPTYLNIDPSFLAQAQTRLPNENWYSSPEAQNVEISDIFTFHVKDGTYTIDIDDIVRTGHTDPNGYNLTFYKNGSPITPFPAGSYIRVNGLELWFKINNQSTGNAGIYRETDGAEGERSFSVSNLIFMPDDPVGWKIEQLEVIYPGESNDFGYVGGWYVCPVGETTTAIDIEFQFPAGLFYVDGSGDKQEKSIVVLIKVESEDGGYNQIHSMALDEIIKPNGGACKSIGFPYALRPKVSIQRATPEDFSGNAASKVVVKEIKSRLQTPSSYPDVTTVAVEIYPANNEISRSSESKINLRGITRKLPTLAQMEANSGLTNTATRSLATAAAYVVREIVGGAEAVDRIDWDALDALNTTLASRSDYFDGEFTEPTTIWEALKIIFKPGYCEPVIKNGKLSAVRNVAGSNFTQMFTPDLMVGDGLQIDHKLNNGSDVDGVEVEYFDTEQNGMTTVECDLGSDAFDRSVRINAIGIVDRDRAWRLGMRERLIASKKPAMYTFATELDALNCDYGDPIAIVSPLFARTCKVGHLENVIDSQIYTDVDLDFTASGDHYAIFRDKDGQFQGPYLVTAGPTSRRMVLSSPTSLSFDYVTQTSLSLASESYWSMEPTMFAVGPASSFYKRAIVRSISQQGETQVQVSAEEYVSSIFANDNGTAP